VLSGRARRKERVASRRAAHHHEAIVTYLYRARHDESARRILEALPSDSLRRQAMTIADRLDRDGRIDHKQEVLERQLDKKFGLTAEERALIRSLRVPKRLDAALDAFVFARSKGEVLGHLRGDRKARGQRKAKPDTKRGSTHGPRRRTEPSKA
jgi:hypothetical protein